jgi:para-aminobenzoate synthetase component 1
MTTNTETVNRKSIACKLHYKKIEAAINLPALNKTFAKLQSASILGGNTAAGRFSYWAAEPKEIFEFRFGQENPFGKLQKTLTKYKMDSRLCGNDRENLPKGIFCGGWLGYFGYELGRYIEKLPHRSIYDIDIPLIRLCFYDKLICYDHLENNCIPLALQLPDDNQEPEEKLAYLEKLLEQSLKINVKSPCPADLENIDLARIKCNISRDYYLETIGKIKRYIYDGDVYQVNFSQRFECDYNTRPIELYHWQNHYNPSPYAAYINGGDFHIVSASPEMFVTIADGIISTKPIKGTRPRTGQPQTDEKNFNELHFSEKEQAELNMIIDLERNDLTRVCKYGSIRVSQPRAIETYPTVFHAIATVEGQLRDKTSFCDILKAMFPGGSITGAPKIRSMEIIDETEPAARGVYTGSIGFIGLDGSVCLNIAIRTVIITSRPVLSRVEGKAYVQTGGGIVADSDPNAEWNETIVKARALLAGIKAANDRKDFSKR